MKLGDMQDYLMVTRTFHQPGANEPVDEWNNSNSLSKDSSKNRPLYAHCGMLGHPRDHSFKLHGYPLNYKKNGYSSVVKKKFSSSSEPSQKVDVTRLKRLTFV